MRRLLPATLLLLLPACGTTVGAEKVPYHFRQSLIEPAEADPLLGQAAAPPASRRRPPAARARRWKASRCSRWVGRRFSGPRTKALPRLVRACLGRGLQRQQVLRAEGLRLSNDGRPSPGDLLFFHNTADKNRNGRLDDRFSDTGVVLAVSGERVSFVYLRDQRVRQGVLNLARPASRRLGSALIQNSYLRVISPRDPPRTPYLAGQLLAGFASPSGRL